MRPTLFLTTVALGIIASVWVGVKVLARVRRQAKDRKVRSLEVVFQ